MDDKEKLFDLFSKNTTPKREDGKIKGILKKPDDISASNSLPSISDLEDQSSKKEVSWDPTVISPRPKYECPCCGIIGMRKGDVVYEKETRYYMKYCKKCEDWVCSNKKCWFGESDYCTMCYLDNFSSFSIKDS